MSKYEAILFDFDGVLVDSEPVHYACWTEVLAPFGIDLDWDTYSANCIGITDRAMLTYLCSRRDPPLLVAELYKEYPRKKKMFRERMLALQPIAADVRSLLNQLRQGYKLAVVTSSGRSEVEPVLDAGGVLPLLDTCVFGDEVKRHKPAPDPYLLALERLDVRDALVIEDSEAGIAAAKAADLDVLPIKVQVEMCSQVLHHLRTPTPPR